MNLVRKSQVVGIERQPGHTQKGIEVGLTESASQAVSATGLSSASIRIASGAITRLDVYGNDEPDGTFEPLASTGTGVGGAAVLIIMSGLTSPMWCTIPFDVFPAAYLKFVGDAPGTIDFMPKG